MHGMTVTQLDGTHSTAASAFKPLSDFLAWEHEKGDEIERSGCWLEVLVKCRRALLFKLLHPTQHT